MTDRELLELAAKAANAGIVWYGECWRAQSGNEWTPLTDDGDALRLAVKLGLTIVPNYHVSQESLNIIEFTELSDIKDFCDPTRRAIVRAAAEIGKAMK